MNIASSPAFVMLLFLATIACVIAVSFVIVLGLISLIYQAINSYQASDLHYQQTKELFASYI